MISFTQLLPHLVNVVQLTPRDVEYQCPRCGGRASVKSFGRWCSPKCPRCGNLGEDDFRDANAPTEGQGVERILVGNSGPLHGRQDVIADVAQGKERPVSTGKVAGSNPAIRASSAAQPAHEAGDARDPRSRRLWAPDATTASVGEADADAGIQASEEVSAHQAGRHTAHNDNAAPAAGVNGAGGGRHKPAVDSWKLAIYTRARDQTEDLLHKGTADSRAAAEMIVQSSQLENWIATVNQQRNLPQDNLTYDPALTPVEIDEEIQVLARALLERYTPLPAVQNGNGKVAVVPALSLIVTENAEQAIISNREYLSRPAIVERLYYTQHISLGVGGKHEGKTTNVRTEALAIAMGRPIYGRETMQTPVIYAASDDEYPSTRMELLRMGWNPAIPLIMVKVVTQEGNVPEPEKVLVELARRAEKEGSRFVVLDMLFDFVRITDEIKYAQTREAIGKIQVLADAISGHVRSTHHSPKWMPDAATAAKAALGSQGIAARFSPILLSKQWAKDLYTIESTMTRDPRGMALPVTVVERDELGWATAKGEMKSWMKWKVYASRILDLFESSEPGMELTVNYVVQSLEVSRQEIQNAMRQMTLGDKPALYRTKAKGHTYKYGLINNGIVEGDQKPPRDVYVDTPVDNTQGDNPYKQDLSRPKKDWGDNGDDLDENGIPKWK